MDESCVDCDCVITDESYTAEENAARWVLFKAGRLPVGSGCGRDGACGCHANLATPA